MGLSYVGRLSIRQTSRQYRREGERKHQVGASGVVVVYISHSIARRATGRADQRHQKSNKLHDRDEVWGNVQGLQDARSIEYGSFPLASWLCKMPSPRLHFLAGLAAGDP